MSKEKIIGNCHICQNECELTYEHIPPHKAFNSLSTKVVTGDELTKLLSDRNRKPWECEGLKYKPMQRGIGMYSLCQRCNNLTGTLYGEAYIYLANVFHSININNNIPTPGLIEVTIKDVYPLRFVKQVLSMFCSTYDGLTKTIPEIKDILLDKNKKDIDKTKIKLTMHILKNYRISYSGLNILAYADLSTRNLVSIDAYPFSFTLELDPNGTYNEELDIMNFFDYDYDKCCSLKFSIPIYEKNTVFPEDHRNKDDFK